MSEPLRILLIDDSPEDRELARRALARLLTLAEVTEVVDATTLQHALAQGHCDAVVLDCHLGWGDGLGILLRAKARWPHCAVVVHTATGSEETAANAIAVGADEYVLKTGGDAVRLPAAVQAALRRAHEARERARLTAIIESTSDLVSTADAQGNLSFINVAGRRMLGLAETGSLDGYRILDFHPQWAGELVMREGLPTATRDGAWHGETAFLTPEGRELAVSQVIIAHKDSSGCVEYYSTIARDISELKRAERAQRALYRISEAASAAVDLPDLYAALHAIIAELMPATNFYIAIHDAGSDALSFPYFADDFDAPPLPRKRGKGLTEYVLNTGATLHASPAAYADLVRSGAVEAIGSPPSDWLGVPLKSFERATGALVVQSYQQGVRFSDEDRRLLEFVSSQVTAAIERTRAATAVRTSEQHLRALFAAMSDVVFTLDRDGHYLSIAPTNPKLLYRPANELIGRTQHDVLPRENADWGVATIRRALDEGRSIDVEYSLDIAGATVWFEGTVSPIADERVIWVARDVTRRKEAENRLRESELRYRLLFQQAPVGVFHYDTTMRITDCNDRFVEILRSTRARLIGLDMCTIRDSSVLPALRAPLQGLPGSYEGSYQATTGAAEPWVSLLSAPLFDVSGAVSGAVCIVEDMSDRHRLEAQLRQSQKIEAIGRLAGGVAHDFNNLLQALLGAVQLLRLHADDPVQTGRIGEELELLVQRGAALTRQLLLFSRREITKPEPFDLGEVVDAGSRMLRRLLREDVRLRIELAPQALTLEADRGQIEQVIMNLVVNAADAMPDGGEIVIRTGGEEARAWLEVQDDGTGMPESIKEHVFEPFFTTKEPGKGTGLGLAVVHGIVIRHGGSIEVESAPGRGSTFRVNLPLRPGVEPSVPAVTPDRAPPAGGMGERILLVEDQDDARKAIAEILARLGYEVTQAASGGAAFDLPPEVPFDLLLSDIVLPDTPGTDVAVGLQSRWPKMRVILMSGYTEDEVARRAVGVGLVRFLQKPFSMDVLAREIRTALGEAPTVSRP